VAKLLETAPELARSNDDLESFAHAASHDMKEPLRTVASFTQLLSSRYQGRLDADADQFIGFAVGGATRMQRLIDDLLTYAHAGSAGLKPAHVRADAALADAVAGLRAAIDAAGATVTSDPLPVVHADRGQLTQLFQNLVSNAVKFRGSDAPCIHVAAIRENGEWIFSVRDNGIGVEARFAERIFTMFQRIHADRFAGSGIGLALSKRIVERHGGRIWMESEPGKGSTLRFTLRADEPHSPPAPL
jgi:light-regulated signal transduction histidine kinase (bacteriophytochrome)